MLPRAPGPPGSILGDAALAPINSFETGEGRGGEGRKEEAVAANFKYHSLQPESDRSGLLLEIGFYDSWATGRATKGAASTAPHQRTLQPPLRGPR